MKSTAQTCLSEFTALRQENAPRATPAHQPLRILHVDDSPVCREVVRMVLSKGGHHVTSANDGQLGAHRVEAGLQDFDLVITDHEMPEWNGLQFVTRLHELAFPGHILVFSGALTPPLITAYKDEGVDALLAKPSIAREILATVNAFAKIA